MRTRFAHENKMASSGQNITFKNLPTFFRINGPFEDFGGDKLNADMNADIK